MSQNEHQRVRRQKRRRERTLERLNEFAPAYPVEIMYRSGELRVGHIQGVETGYSGPPILLHGTGPLDSAGYYGSKLEERDLFANTPLHEIGYVRNPATGKKISLMAFQSPKRH